MGSLERRIEALEKLYHASVGSREGNLEDQEEARRAKVIAELERVEERRRSMSPEEHRAWLESPECRAEREALEAEIRLRRQGLSE